MTIGVVLTPGETRHYDHVAGSFLGVARLGSIRHWIRHLGLT